MALNRYAEGAGRRLASSTHSSTSHCDRSKVWEASVRRSMKSSGSEGGR